jgi:hypothetical protein
MSATISLIVQCWYDRNVGATQLRVMMVDGAAAIHVPTNSFLVRWLSSEQGRVERCFIRHIASGREIYLQSGPGLHAFIQDCLLTEDPGPPPSQARPS